MLTFESPIYEEEGVIVFRDHASPTLFHYLAGPPHLSRDASGRPNLLLLKYRHALEALSGPNPPARDKLGGGFLLFGVDCGLSQSTKDSIKSALQSRMPPDAGPISLVPVLYSAGSVRVLALDHDTAGETPADGAEGAAGPKTGFVRKVLGTAKPSLMQDQRAIFALELSVDGVVLLEEAFESELSPIGVMYDLEFAGLLPALQVKAHVDMERVREKLELKFGVRVPLSSGGGTSGGGTTAGGGAESEAATEESTADARSAESSNTTTSSGRAASGGEVKLGIGLTIEELREEGAIEIDIIRQQIGESVDQMEQRALALLKETILDNFFRPVMTTQTLTPQAAAQQLQQATSQGINRGKAGSSSQIEVAFELHYSWSKENKTADFDYRVRSPEKRTHAPNGFFSALVGNLERDKHIRSIDLDDPFFELLEVQVSTTAEFGPLGLDALIVEMAYGPDNRPTVEKSFVLTPAAPTAAEPFRAFEENGDSSYRHRVMYKFGDDDDTAADQESLTIPWARSSSRALVVHPPDHLDMLRILLEPARVDWKLVSRIEVVVTYRDPDSDFTARRTFSFGESSPAENWTIRLPENAPSTYTVQQTWHLVAGSKIVGGEVEWRERRFFVNDPFVDRLPITVDPQVAPEDVQRLIVDIRYEDEDNGLDIRRTVEMVAPEFRAKTIEVPIIDPDKLEYTYRVRLVKPGGLTEEGQPKTTDALTIVVTPGGSYMNVDLVLLGQMAPLSLTAVQVDIKAEPLDGKPERVESHLFLPTDDVRKSQQLLIRADRPEQFFYRIQLFFLDGRTATHPWKQHDSRILAVPLAALVAP